MERVVIVGGVAGGMSAAARLRRLNAAVEIVVIEKSGYVSFANCGLPYYLGGVIKQEESLLLQTPASLFKRFRLDVRINSEVLKINRAEKKIDIRNAASGEEYNLAYDKLILSPGAYPIRLPIPGFERALTLRNIEDVQKIYSASQNEIKTAVVIGGGFIGLEMAENLKARGISVSVIELANQVLAPLDIEMSRLVEKELERNEVSLFLSTEIKEITANDVVLNDGQIIPADIVIAAIGVKPDISLAKSADLAIGERGGIIIDENNLTSDLSIYAIGDATEKIDSYSEMPLLVPLANIANRHGRVVADHIAGLPLRKVLAQGTAIVKVFELTVAISGWNEKRAKAAKINYLAIHTHPASHAGYYPGAKNMALKLIVEKESGKILGVQGVGQDGVDKRIDVISTAMRGGITAPELADLELAYAPPFGSAKDPVNMLGYVAENALSELTPTVQWDEVAAYQNNGWSVIDVRSPQEFERGHIPNSVNISVDEIRELVELIPAGKLLVTCQVGLRGHVATRLLREWGREAVNLDGGYATWSNSPANLIRNK